MSDELIETQKYLVRHTTADTYRKAAEMLSHAAADKRGEELAPIGRTLRGAAEMFDKIAADMERRAEDMS